ncbi:unnamed protein product, partial [Tetraodon nigroviridis]
KKQAVKRHHHKHNLKHRYEFLETLGKGTYGKVKKARESSGRLVAIKSIRKDKIKDEQDLVHIRREIEIMSAICHPHIITIYEGTAGGTDSALNGIVHRDLKLENILLDGGGHVKIADFGLSNLYRGDEYLQTFCGSPLYASPEIVNGRPYRGPEVDTWSLGVLLYTLVHGTMPFDGQNHQTLVQQISTGTYRKPSHPSGESGGLSAPPEVALSRLSTERAPPLGSDACGLIRWMLMVNPERRATIEEIAGHWWLNWGYQQLLTGGSADVVRQRSLRRSRKENNVSQTVHEAGADAPPSKSILKRRSSAKQKAPADSSSCSAGLADSAAPAGVLSTASLPRKGILKKPAEESGYYSSSPENSDSGLAGILKRNGKFSSGRMQEFGSLDQLAASLPRCRARPSGAISEDSILSSESFDQLDLPERVGPPARLETPAQPSMRGCVSADNLLDIQEDGSLEDGLMGPWTCYRSRVADSAFSITDCDHVTEAYKQAM